MTKVYVSSTYLDLKEYREAVARQLRRIGCFEVHAMEDYVARDDRAKEVCVADVAACDIYIGIFAWRAGFVPPGEKVAITEIEYRAAVAAGKKCLVFLTADDASWNPQHNDFVTGDGERGARIQALREELKVSGSPGFFRTADELAALVSASVQAAPLPGVPAEPQFRELRRSLLVACAPADRALGEAYAELAQRWFARGIEVSVTALFADGELAFGELEALVTRCEAALVLLTPGTFDLLRQQEGRVASVLGVLSARLGQVRLLTCGDLGGELPASWRVGDVLAAPAGPPDRMGAPSPALLTLQKWAGEAFPAGASRTVGLPVCVFAMTQAELAGLPAEVAGGAGPAAPGALAPALAQAGLHWRERYAGSREAWLPFGPGGPTISRIVASMVEQVNARPPEKLRDRHIKPQWYPFDALLAEYRRTATGKGDPTGLRQVYRDVARAGCVVIVDELSLCHPELGEAFRSSPIASGETVALVTVSPVEPRSNALLDVLERETRLKLAGAFDRYDMELDPQCELAIPDARRLKRWLHANLPETVARLRDPRPSSGKLDAFFSTRLGPGAARRSGGEYGWGGSGTP